MPSEHPPTLEKDRTRRLIIRGLSHDYKRILLSLTQRALEFKKHPLIGETPEVQDTYQYFAENAVIVSDRLDKIGNEIYKDISIPATAILTKHSSALERKIADLVKTAQRFQFIISIFAADNQLLIQDSTLLVEQAKRAQRQIQALLLLPFKTDELRYRTINVKNEISRIIIDLYALLLEYGCNPKKTVEINTSENLHTDQTMFTIAVSNIIANAVIHTGMGEKLIVTIDEDAEYFTPDGSKDPIIKDLYLTISDNGPGIPAEERCEIFHLFRQGKRGLLRNRGSGVGLTFARLAMELLGGTAILKEGVKEGAAFILRFPNQN
jgi:signal transduction histidine kinase